MSVSSAVEWSRLDREAKTMAAIAGEGTPAFRARMLLQGLIMLLCTLGGALVGSPPPRFIMAACALAAHLMGVSPALAGQVIFVMASIGPYAEALTYYIKYMASDTLKSADSSPDWYDMSGFYLIAILGSPALFSVYGMDRKKYMQLLMHTMPASGCFSFLLAPSWAPDVSTQVRIFSLFMLAYILSIAFFMSLELTAYETREREKAHERYVAALSHDFGTPITSMTMAVQQMISTCAARGITGLDTPLAAMSAAAEVMRALRQKAIDFGKLQLGKALEPQLGVVPIRTLLNKLEQVMRYVPHSDDVLIEYSVDEALAQEVETDGSYVFMILLNLTSNAFKATRSGLIRVAIELTPKHLLRLRVSDTGIGLSVESVANGLWKPFYKVEKTGTGLGLFHIRELSSALGGTVGYEPNTMNVQGSVFWAEIPYLPVAADPYCEKLDSKPFIMEQVAGFGGVLVVEDNAFIQEMTLVILDTIGVKEIKQAFNGLEALDLVISEDAPYFMLILMDLQMPFMDGFECVKQIRSWESANARRPMNIIALTASGDDPSCREACADVGMNGILSKPINLEALHELVAKSGCCCLPPLGRTLSSSSVTKF